MPDDLASLGTALADRYAIERELGSGATAIVYLAQDLKLGRSVALKVLRAEVAAVLGSERFLREIRTAARLQHPHIVALHDSGQANGFLYYVMPYVEGESLRDVLTREPQLPLEQALRFAREVAEALAYAHQQGLIHRDIKPENILITRGADGTLGHALVADFGIARAVSVSGGDSLTATGLAIGTPAYMSPEQASAERAIDGRTDVYALGCVLYEMLAGHPPFLGRTSHEILARHTLDPVPPLRTGRPEIPPAVEAAVVKALAKTPADRFGTTSGFMEALVLPPASGANTRSFRPVPAALAGVALLGIIAVLLFRPWRTGAGATTASPSIAVLAFNNLGGDPANEPFSDGIADELTTALGKVEGLSVAARTSAFSFKGKGLPAREIGSRLQVRYVVEGAVRQSGPRRRVSAQLIDVTRDQEVWSGTFEHDTRNADVFALQDSITGAIVRELRVKLTAGSVTRLAARATANPEAHDLYLQGRYFFAKRDLVSLARAREYFERAIALDSSYALAYAGLSEAYSHSSVFGGMAPHEAFPRAKAAVRRALELDSTLVEGLTSLGFIALFYDWDFDAAGRAFDRALAIDPRYPPARLFHAWYYAGLNRMEDAVEEFRTAVRLEPFYTISNIRLATGLVLSRRFEEALTQARRTLDLEPTFFQGHSEVGLALLGLGRCAEAVSEFEQAPHNRAALTSGMPGYAYAKCGHRDRAQALLRQFEAEAREGRYVSHYALAQIHTGLGNHDAAFAELDRALEERAWPMFVLRSVPFFDDLRNDPRFARVVERVGFPASQTR
jgi:TolB-like protein/tetratricopeptide (TPR) repeat protein/tRNA A-37 threonylcarbamoyl transferase component Bud32